jgi:hypothetical protein
MLTGVGTGLEQMRRGVFDTQASPGQGIDASENFEHLLHSKAANLVFNIPPEHFEEEANFMIEEGLIEPVRFDGDGAEKPITYQYFLSEAPESVVEGVFKAQYNILKGAMAGMTLLICAPPKDMVDGYMNVEDDSELSRLGGAAKGLGSGVLRGTVGSVIMITGGLAHGAQQLAGGVVALKNVPRSASAAATDASRVATDPLHTLLLQKGYGLEEFLEREQIKQMDDLKQQVDTNLQNIENAENDAKLPASEVQSRLTSQSLEKLQMQEEEADFESKMDQEELSLRKSVEKLDFEVRSVKSIRSGGGLTPIQQD